MKRFNLMQKDASPYWPAVGLGIIGGYLVVVGTLVLAWFFQLELDDRRRVAETVVGGVGVLFVGWALTEATELADKWWHE